MIALAAGILPNLPGFLGTIKVMPVSDVWITLYNYAWFVGFGISFGVYALLSRGMAEGGEPAAA
jgi:NCS1 family nucleobase:cation symporter-1